MQQTGWKSGILKIAEWLARLAWINLLWIAFTLCGLVILGFLPATAAMFAIVRKWMKGNLKNSVFKEFWGFFKAEFWKANAAGGILVLTGYILYIDLFVYDFGNQGVQQVLQVLIYIVALVYLLTAVFFFPVYVQYELKWFQYMKYSILMAFSSPFRAVSMLLLGYGLLILIQESPGTAFFFSGSGMAYLSLMVTLPLFNKLLPAEKNSAS